MFTVDIAVLFALVILILGIIANVVGIRQKAYATYAFWFWNVVWLAILASNWAF